MQKSIKVTLITCVILALMTTAVFAGTELAAGDVAVVTPANAAPGVTVTAGAAQQTVQVTVTANDGLIPSNSNNSQDGWVAIPETCTITNSGEIVFGAAIPQLFTSGKNFAPADSQTLTFPIKVNATSGTQAKLYEIVIPVTRGTQVSLGSNYTPPKMYITVVNPNQNTTTGGFLPPLKDGAKYKIGQTIPVKFKAPVVTTATTSTPTAFISLEYRGSTRAVSIPTNLSRIKATKDNLFRFDASNNQYTFNLDTRALTAGQYLVKATMSNGPTYSVLITLEAKANNGNASAAAAAKTINKK